MYIFKISTPLLCFAKKEKKKKMCKALYVEDILGVIFSFLLTPLDKLDDIFRYGIKRYKTSSHRYYKNLSLEESFRYGTITRYLEFDERYKERSEQYLAIWNLRMVCYSFYRFVSNQRYMFVMITNRLKKSYYLGVLPYDKYIIERILPEFGCSYVSKLPIYMPNENMWCYQDEEDLESILPSKILKNINSKGLPNSISPKAVKSKAIDFTKKDKN